LEINTESIGFISGSVLVLLLIYWRKELMILAVREDTNHGVMVYHGAPRRGRIFHLPINTTAFSRLNLTFAESLEANSSFAEDLKHWQD
jgi:hypothetical protein